MQPKRPELQGFSCPHPHPLQASMVAGGVRGRTICERVRGGNRMARRYPALPLALPLFSLCVSMTYASAVTRKRENTISPRMGARAHGRVIVRARAPFPCYSVTSLTYVIDKKEIKRDQRGNGCGNAAVTQLPVGASGKVNPLKTLEKGDF